MIKRWTRAAAVGVATAAIASATSCAALEDYSGHAARNACRSAGTCTVYDQTGRHQVPCWPTEDGPMVYPGDPGWPFEPGVCDTVAEMNAPWPGTGLTTTAANAARSAAPNAPGATLRQ
jgi:hypothetical protein